MAPKLKIPLPPALKTRAKNAMTHPGLRKGLSDDEGEQRPLPPSPSAEEKKDEKEQKAAQTREAAQRRTAANATVAAVEDQLRRQDIDRDLIANHPPAVSHAPVPEAALKQGSKAVPGVEQSDVQEELAANGLDETEADGYEEHVADPDNDEETSSVYDPAADGDYNADDDEQELMDIDAENDLTPPSTKIRSGGRGGHGSRGGHGGSSRGTRGQGNRGGAKQSSREAITSARSTTTGSGTPEVPSRKRALTASAEDPIPLKKKNKPAAKSGISSAFKPLQAQRQRGNDIHRVEDAQPADGSAFQYGGYAADGEDDFEERKAVVEKDVAVKGENGQIDVKKFTSRVKVEPGSKTLDFARARSIKEARGGDTKWKDSHLGDSNVQDIFHNDMLPLAKATLATRPPWANLSPEDVQDIVNITYGQESGIVITDSRADPFMGVLAARFTNFRSEFASACEKTIRDILKDNADVFDSPDTIKEWVAFMRTAVDLPHGAKTYPRQWREWVDDKKHRGFMQSDMIIRPFGEVWGAVINSLPDHLHPTVPPIGALLLCDQANDRALSCWATGAFVPIPKNRANVFSADNFGDYSGFVVENNKKIRKTIKRATQYMPSLQALDLGIWQDLRERALTFSEDSGKRRKGKGKGRGQSTGDVNSDAVDSAEPDFIITDQNWDD